MNAEIAQKWAAKLRSGDYKQGTGYLNNEDQFCCLGVLCELAIEEGVPVTKFTQRIESYYKRSRYDGEEYELPTVVQEWADMRDPRGTFKAPGEVLFRSLTQLNDAQTSFSVIADYIDRYADVL
jgi:hypothetical protein